MSNTSIIPGGSPVDSLALVHVDGVTITGDGANVPLTAIGGSIAIHTDGTTILGNGTQEAPLRTSDAIQDGQTSFTTEANSAILIGMALFPFQLNEGGGTLVAQVAPADGVVQSNGVPAIGMAGSAAAGQGDAVSVVRGGPLTLTIAQWNAVVIAQGTGGGLAPGSIYYVTNGSGTPGKITFTAPTGGLTPVMVGWALTQTTMYVAPALTVPLS